jgi:2-aminoadipate transaminase
LTTLDSFGGPILVRPDLLSRRAAHLASVLPAGAPASNLAFDSGHAANSVLPDLTAEAQRALTTFRLETLQYAPRPGLPELRAHIVDQMAADGVALTRDNVLVTNGAKHAIELVCRVLLDEGDAIVVTRPTYFTAIPIFRSFGVHFIEVGQDRDGLDVAELLTTLELRERQGLRPPKFIYNVPDFHNPTGLTMSLDRRRALIDVATARGIHIVEDSPYRKVRFEGQSIPSLKALDSENTVVYVGTFSKLMAPGLRVGWAAASPDMIARMIQLKSDGGSCPLTQRIIVEFLSGGRLGDHIARVQATYRENRDAMAAALHRELPEARFETPAGGYYVWLTLPEDADGDLLARVASEAGVTVIPGSKFFAPSDTAHPKNHMRVAYSHATPDEIDDGIRRLGAAYRTITATAGARSTVAGVR